MCSVAGELDETWQDWSQLIRVWTSRPVMRLRARCCIVKCSEAPGLCQASDMYRSAGQLYGRDMLV